jgi:hypothetical protein
MSTSAGGSVVTRRQQPLPTNMTFWLAPYGVITGKIVARKPQREPSKAIENYVTS